nr:hypothetical protein Iba_chr04eCG8390 [Ipomoea batatas]
MGCLEAHQLSIDKRLLSVNLLRKTASRLLRFGSRPLPASSLLSCTISRPTVRPPSSSFQDSARPSASSLRHSGQATGGLRSTPSGLRSSASGLHRTPGAQSNF